jgi:hypothetical protein
MLDEPIRQISDGVLWFLLAQNCKTFQKRRINTGLDFLDLWELRHSRLTAVLELTDNVEYTIEL